MGGLTHRRGGGGGTKRRLNGERAASGEECITGYRRRQERDLMAGVKEDSERGGRFARGQVRGQGSGTADEPSGDVGGLRRSDSV